MVCFEQSQDAIDCWESITYYWNMGLLWSWSWGSLIVQRLYSPEFEFVSITDRLRISLLELSCCRGIDIPLCPGPAQINTIICEEWPLRHERPQTSARCSFCFVCPPKGTRCLVGHAKSRINTAKPLKRTNILSSAWKQLTVGFKKAMCCLLPKCQICTMDPRTLHRHFVSCSARRFVIGSLQGTYFALKQPGTSFKLCQRDEACWYII